MSVVARALIVVAALALTAAGWYAVDAQRITEHRVHALYEAQGAAWSRGDGKALCAQFASDYVGHEQQARPAGARLAQPDKTQACFAIDRLMKLRDSAHERGLPVKYTVTVGRILMARDGHSAEIELREHLDIGGEFLSDTVGADIVGVRDGELLLTGRRSMSHVSGPKAAEA